MLSTDAGQSMDMSTLDRRVADLSSLNIKDVTGTTVRDVVDGVVVADSSLLKKRSAFVVNAIKKS